MSFIKKLQSLDEPTKTRVLIVATVVVMVIVLYLWLIYFNGILSAGTVAGT